MQKVYFDSAATTQIRPEVLEVMTRAMAETYGNPSSTHSYGRAARTGIEQARKNIAKTLGAHPSEIIFTSGGTEADNMAFFGAVRDLGVKRIITTALEHHAVLHTAEYLQKVYDIAVVYLDLETGGVPSMSHLRQLLEADDTPTLVSLMHVNNEVGNMTDIHQAALLCKEYGALIHSDAVQSVGHWEWNLEETPVDFLAASAHKFHGPKGVGFAFIRKGLGIKPLIHGGEQERGHRAGTESYHNILGLEKAFTMAYETLEDERAYVLGLKEYFMEQLRAVMPGVCFNGLCADPEKSTYTLLNVSLELPPEKADMLLFQLDLKGIACSRGSACQSGSQTGSHVLRALLSADDLRKPSLRFSFSVFNTREEIDHVIASLKDFAG